MNIAILMNSSHPFRPSFGTRRWHLRCWMLWLVIAADEVVRVRPPRSGQRFSWAAPQHFAAGRGAGAVRFHPWAAPLRTPGLAQVLHSVFGVALPRETVKHLLVIVEKKPPAGLSRTRWTR